MNDFIYGRRNVTEFLKSSSGKDSLKIHRILVIPSRDTDKLLHLFPREIKITKTDRKEFDKILPGKNHQGIAIEVSSLSGLKNLDDFKTDNLSDTVLLLDRVQDAGNLGSILRTAECLGARSVVIPDKEAADVTADVIRLSSGAANFLDIYKVSNLRNCLDFLKKNSYWIVTLDEDGDENWDLKGLEKIAVIMGNEKEGVRHLLRQESDFVFRIPMHGKISSLNVGVSTGIALDRIINRS